MATPKELRDAMAQAAEESRKPVPQPVPTEGQRVRSAVAANAADPTVQQRVQAPGQRIRSAVAAVEPVTHNLNPPVQVQPPIRGQIAGIEAERFRGGPIAIDSQGVAQQRAAPIIPQQAVPPNVPGGARAQIGMPTPAPQPFYNRPMSMQPAMDAAKASGRVIQRVAAPVARVAGPVATAGMAAAEGVQTARDVRTPGMTATDKTGRVMEGGARMLGTAALGVKGAGAGASLGTAILPGPGTVVGGALGGIAGGLAGYLAPDAANNVYNWAKRKLGGSDDENQLPSARAAELQAQQRPAVQSQPAAAKIDAPPAAAVIPPQPASTAAPAPRAQLSKMDRVMRDARANGTDRFDFDLDGQTGNVSFTNRPAPQVAAPQAAAPQGAGIDDLSTIWTNSPGNVFAAPDSGIRLRSLGRFANEWADGGYNAQGNFIPHAVAAQPEQYLAAKTQYAIDAMNPNAARLRDESALENVRGGNRLQEQVLQNQGSATSAAISAGPGHANAKTAAERLQHDQAQDKVKILGGGQEPVFDPATGMYVGMRTVPQRAIRQRSSGDAPAPVWEDAMAPSDAKPTLVKGKTYTDAKGRKATWDGTQYVPVK